MLAHENSAIVTNSGRHPRTTLKGVEGIAEPIVLRKIGSRHKLIPIEKLVTLINGRLLAVRAFYAEPITGKLRLVHSARKGIAL